MASKNASPAAKAGKDQGASAKPATKTSAGPTTSTGSTPGLEVTSKMDGFRRAGIAWTKTPTFVALSDLTDEQVAQIKNEPELTVTEVDGQ
jgi:hypothetical protein